LTTLFSFNGTNGSGPSASLLQGNDGNFYGTTANGGLGYDGANNQSGLGTVFKMTPGGSLITLVSFNNNNGAHPLASLVQGRGGNFYGTTGSGGAYTNFGTVFKLTPGGGLTTLVSFNNTNGALPSASLVQGSDGNFYGTTRNGGAGSYNPRARFPSYGTVFKVTPDGSLTTLVFFGLTNGCCPQAGLIQGSDGNFYGITSGGGNGGRGGVFKVTPDGVLTTVTDFSVPNGPNPYDAGLVQGSDGNFYGTTGSGGSGDEGTVFKVTPGGSLTTLVSFLRSEHGEGPLAGLAQGSDGNFYGTTFYGGAEGVGYGTVFKVTPHGNLTTLFSFNDFPNGGYPSADLVQSSDGNFYGTTYGGGDTYADGGTVFKITPTGSLTTLVRFNNTNGGAPQGGLVRGSDGNFYGTTWWGGAGYSPFGEYGSGSVFKVTSGGSLRTLLSFNNTNGAYPEAGLVRGSDGNFYGTTSSGGAGYNPAEGNYGFGTVFRVTSGGTLTTLVSFSGTNGADPSAGVVQGNDGNFYDTTRSGGTYGHGTVFKLTPSGTFTTLYSFNGTNGSRPDASVMQGNDGNFYGTTAHGGLGYDGTNTYSGLGTVFQVTANGALTTLVSFNGTNGAHSFAGLVRGSDGHFYGTTYLGGADDLGTIFRLIVNHTPSFTKGPDQTVLEDAGAQSVANWAASISAGSDYESSQRLTFLVSNNNSSLFAVQPAISPAGTLTYTPAPNANGSATITVFLKDDGGTTAGGQDTSGTEIFLITVLPVNDPPVAVARENLQPLVVTLQATMASFERGSMEAGTNQLRAFQNKVRAQVGPIEPALAHNLNRAAEQIINALNGP